MPDLELEALTTNSSIPIEPLILLKPQHKVSQLLEQTSDAD
jgi:hypothetical protein